MRKEGHSRPWRIGTAYQAVLLAAALGACASTQDRLRPASQCQGIMDRGIFTSETIASSPAMAEALRQALCQSETNTRGSLNHMGHGYGTEVLGQTLEPTGGVYLNSQESTRWRVNNCDGVWPEASSPEFVPRKNRGSWEERVAYHQAWQQWREAQDALWEPARALVQPAGLRNWRNCRAFAEDLYRWETLIACSVVLGDDQQTVTFQARFQTIDYFRQRHRLRDPLQAEGVRCQEPLWLAGTRLGFKVRRITCQRKGGEAVLFRIKSGRYACESSLPEVEPELAKR